MVALVPPEVVLRPLLLVPAIALLSCRGTDETKTPSASPDTGGTVGVCPPPGGALAREMTTADQIPGETAVGTAGDFIVQNDVAAFVITRPDAGSTYWYYGGAVADAVAMDGCDFNGEDKLDELGIVLGELELTAFEESVLRAFRAESVTVLADGSDGEAAVVRATGTDATHWLVEYTLMKEALSSGGRALSSHYGLDIQVDYILEPDSPVLRIELTVTNGGAVDRSLVSASLLSFGGTMDLHKYATSALEIGPLDLGLAIPWLVATDGSDALAFAVEAGNLAYAGVSGVDIAVDANQALTDPIELAPGASDTRTTFLVVGAAGGPSATVPLATVNPEPVPGRPYTLLAGTGVVEDDAGQGVPDAMVSLLAQAPGEAAGTLDVAWTDASGQFTLSVPDFGDDWSWQLQVDAPGRATMVSESFEASNLPGELTVGSAGSVVVSVVDETGADAPARVELTPFGEGGRAETLWALGTASHAVVPGTYTYTATRGYEHAPVAGTLTVPEDGSVALDLELVPVLDTSGWVSIDTHVHSWDSPDSRVDPADVLRHAAAHGLDLVLYTEHEHIVDRSTLPVDIGVSQWVDSIGGEEVTASVPEHLTMFPVAPDGGPRGGPVEWFGRDIDTLFADMRARSGGGVNLLNHPSYLGLVGWDRLLAEPTLADPTLLGLAPDAALWSWDFDGMEVMNGHSSPFESGNGRWLDWQSMLNAGHPLVAVGCSDDHGGTKVGFPRTYVPASTDVPADVDTDEVVAAFHEGRAVASTGAFARVTVDDRAGIGDLYTPDTETIEVAIQVEALPEVDVTHVVVFWNCDTVASIPATDPEGIEKLDALLQLDATEDGHLTVAAFGAERLPAGLPQFDPTGVPRALTSPIFIDGSGDGAFSAPGGRACSVDLSAPEG